MTVTERTSLSDISDTLLDILQRTGSVQSLLHHGFKLLDNPLLVIDASFGYIASVGTDQLDDEPVWSSTVKNGVMPPEYVDALMEYDDVFGSTHHSEPFLMLEKDNLSGLVHSGLAVKLIYSGTMLGYLELLELHPISEREKEILLMLSRYLSLAVGFDSRKNSFSPSVTETFFTSVLLNRIKSADEIGAYQKTFSIKLYDYLHIISIEIVGRKWHPDYLFYLLKTFKDYFFRNIVIIVNTLIVVLYDSREIGKTESPSFVERFTRILERNSCHAAISLPFQELRDIPRYYEQTLECLKVGGVLRLHDPILYFQNLIEYHMILSFARSYDVNLLIHPHVRRLMQADRENEGDLTHTLFAFLGNQQNVAATARALSIHYNTLKYRIKRITELTGVDLANGDEMFRIALSERALEVIKVMDPRDEKA
jgi:hypothetical protein